jgi:TBCC domain-containing protein 1
LEEHITEVGIQPTINKWNESLALGAIDPHDSLSHPTGASDKQAEPASCVDPDQFTTFLIPNWFAGEAIGSTKDNPFPLPDAYKAVQQTNVCFLFAFRIKLLVSFSSILQHLIP